MLGNKFTVVLSAPRSVLHLAPIPIRLKKMDSRVRSLFIVHISMLILSLGSSIIYTGIWPYLQRVRKKEKTFEVKFLNDLVDAFNHVYSWTTK
jgi:hypothetical protein